MLVTNQLITQVFLVPEITKQLLTYDRLRWYRSATGRNGYYEPATALSAGPAELRGRPLTRALAGTSLTLRIDGFLQLEVPFAGPDPIEVSAVAALLDAATPGALAATVEDGLLVLRTVQVGSAASLEVLESSAAPLLGFLVGEDAVGLSADSTLQAGISEYRFSDYQSSTAHWYQIEYLHSSTGARSAPSATFLSRVSEGIPLDRLIGCFVRLADMRGNPLGGRRVVFHNVPMPNKVTAEGKSWAIFRQYEEIVTDPNGYAKIFLVRGAVVDVTISGTGFTRRIELPTTGDIIDVLDPALSVQDEFGIRSPEIDFAIRTS